VRLLENRLGVSLFVRGPRGLRLTPAGTRLLEPVAPHLNRNQAALRPLVESGRLAVLFPERMKARYAHYLVYPERSANHAGFQAFRTWLHAEAAAFRDSGAADAMPLATNAGPGPRTKAGRTRAPSPPGSTRRVRRP
jgi:DNA-binding transcriptional LysR family regulator